MPAQRGTVPDMGDEPALGVRGEDHREVDPEVAVIMINVAARSRHQGETTQLLQDRLARVLNLLDGYRAGIEKRDTTGFGIYPEHKKGSGERVANYIGSITVNVTVADFAALGELIPRFDRAGGDLRLRARLEATPGQPRPSRTPGEPLSRTPSSGPGTTPTPSAPGSSDWSCWPTPASATPTGWPTPRGRVALGYRATARPRPRPRTQTPARAGPDRGPLPDQPTDRPRRTGPATDPTGQPGLHRRRSRGG